MILHIPYASFLIPENLRNQILLSDNELAEELLLMTDWFVDIPDGIGPFSFCQQTL